MNISINEIIESIINCFALAEFAESERIALYHLQTYPNNAQLNFVLGVAQQQQAKYTVALASLQKAHHLAPSDINIINALASCYQTLGQHDMALSMMQLAFEQAPLDAQVLTNLGSAYEKLDNVKEALKYYDLAIQQDAMFEKAWQNRGMLFRVLNKKSEWLASNVEAHRRFPNSIDILSNLAFAYVGNFEYEKALTLCSQGLQVNEKNAYLMFTKGLAFSALRQFDEAAVCFGIAQVIQPTIVHEVMPHYKNLPVNLSLMVSPQVIYFESMIEEQKSCYWQHRLEYIKHLEQAVLNPESVYDVIRDKLFAFNVLSLDISSAARKTLMQSISEVVQDNVWVSGYKPYHFVKKVKSRIRIGYVSADYRQHPCAILTRKIFELHDNEQFEVYAYSLAGKSQEDYHYRQLVQKNCNVFRDIEDISPLEAAELIYQDDIDILVDLSGYTTFTKPEIFAMRPAPLQISYMGFIHTLGADYMDYALVDNMVVNESAHNDWQEQLIRLPNCLYVYDTDISNEPTKFTREAFGLPVTEIVFCAINANYKIEPVIFTVWMNILKAVPKSVLWILAHHPEVKVHLMEEAEKRGVEKHRLIFAGSMPMEEHVQRYQLADLYLDTYYYGAHTTGMEAVWQGLPMISCPAHMPSSRLGSSMLSSLEMPELIANNLEEYQELAIFYATHHQERLAIREKLKAKRYTAPLFDVKSRVKEIELAYQMVWQRHLDGLPPATIDVPKLTEFPD